MVISTVLKRHAGFCIFLIFFVIYGIFQAPKLLNPGDDIEIVSMGLSQSVPEIFLSVTPTNAGHFYRPIIRLTAHVLFTIFPLSSLTVNTLTIGLVFLLYVRLYRFWMRLGFSSLTTLIVLLAFLSSPFTFSAQTWFADFGTLIIYHLLLWITQAAVDQKHSLFWVCLTASFLAVFCKEHGLILSGLSCLIFLWQKKWKEASVFPVLVLLYFGLRFYVLGHFVSDTPFLRESGFWGQMLPSEVLTERFGSFPYGFYLYTIFANFLDLFLTQPHHGQFGFSPYFAVKIFRLVGYGLGTSLILVAAVKKKWPYPILALGCLACLGMNAILGFSASEYKVLAVGGAVYPILLGLALHGLTQKALPLLRGLFVSIFIFFVGQTFLLYAKQQHMNLSYQNDYAHHVLFGRSIDDFPAYLDVYHVIQKEIESP